MSAGTMPAMPPVSIPEFPFDGDWWDAWEVEYIHAYARAYAAQAVAAEREACAKVLDQRRDNTAFADFEDAYREIANDIRARSKP